MAKDSSKETTHVSDLVLLHSTVAAHLFQTHDGEKVWIPKSQVKSIALGKDIVGADRKTVKEVTDLEIPLWLAEKNGMV